MVSECDYSFLFPLLIPTSTVTIRASLWHFYPRFPLIAAPLTFFVWHENKDNQDTINSCRCANLTKNRKVIHAPPSISPAYSNYGLYAT